MAKRNLHKIPGRIIERIRTFDQDDVIVACVKSLRPEDISRYSHLGLSFEHGKLVLPKPAIPDPSVGRYSRYNVEGHDRKRKDLPKVPKQFEIEAPDWGDWSKGSHTVSWTREVYQIDFYPPKEVTLSVTLLREENSAYLVRFAIDEVLNRRTRNFEQALFYNLNLLQESVGAVDIFPSAASLAEYTATIGVDWQILPPGTVDEVLRGILQRTKGAITADQQAIMKTRIEVISRLNPDQYVIGTEGFVRYFGAKFGDDFVVFENIRYGNALYVMYDSWQELSKKSRIELLSGPLSGPRESFDRIEHRDGWESRLEAMVQEYRRAQQT